MRGTHACVHRVVLTAFLGTVEHAATPCVQRDAGVVVAMRCSNMRRATVTDESLDAVSRPAPPMRIAVLSPPWFAVPPERYGGIESVVALLTDGLVGAGHDVTLFATADSTTRARLVAPYATGAG